MPAPQPSAAARLSIRAPPETGLNAGKFRREKSVHEHEPVPGQPGEGGFVNHLAFRAVDGGFAREMKRQFHNRRDVCETPVLVMQRGETLIGKAGDPSLAQRRQPFRRARCGFKVPEFFNNRAGGQARIFLRHNQLPIGQTVFHAIGPCASPEHWKINAITGCPKCRANSAKLLPETSFDSKPSHPRVFNFRLRWTGCSNN